MLHEFIERLFSPKTWDSSDRRAFLRTKIEIAVNLSFPSFRCTGTILDVGPTGLRCRVVADEDAVIERGQLVQVKYEPYQWKGIHTIECNTRWARSDGFRYKVVGLLFTDPPEVLRRSWVPSVISEGLKAQLDRKQLRAATAIAATIKIEDGSETTGVLRDLSSSGALIESEKPMEEGTRISLTLMFAPPHAPVTFEALVCRCLPHPTFSELGVTFLLSTKQRKFLQELVKALLTLQTP